MLFLPRSIFSIRSDCVKWKLWPQEIICGNFIYLLQQAPYCLICHFSSKNYSCLVPLRASWVAQLVKHLPAKQETPVQFLGLEVPLEKGSAIHCSIPGLHSWLRWYSICLQCRRPGFDPWVGKVPWRRAWQSIQCSCLENPMDWLQSLGSKRVRPNWSDWGQDRTDSDMEEGTDRRGSSVHQSQDGSLLEFLCRFC